MTIVIYAGLSISFEECKKILNAEYYPPVKRGDIYNLLSNRNDIEIIGIIDGVFHQSPAVAHKEILKALKKGISVVGGSSMGALRACELYPYGMIGIGHIFNDYKNGVIESDDDVAVALNPETYEPLSDSWINLKYNFEQAEKNGIISDDEKKVLLDTAKEIYYPKRTFEYVIKKSNLSNETLTMLSTYIKKNKFDIKHEDAKEVIEYIKKLSSNE
ncbi:MAG: TfuA-related McrA-glycine thioamidation protein [Methanosphaera stadtmanae]|nr:TfuA-related McrA-glycine thioamidation protein [Methanosphaera stadtmanae]